MKIVHENLIALPLKVATVSIKSIVTGIYILYTLQHFFLINFEK